MSRGGKGKKQEDMIDSHEKTSANKEKGDGARLVSPCSPWIKISLNISTSTIHSPQMLFLSSIFPVPIGFHGQNQLLKYC